MGHIVLLDIPESTVHRAREIAQQTGRPLEAVLVEWVQRGSSNDDTKFTLLAEEHHIYTPSGGEDTAEALLQYLQLKNDEVG